MLILPGGSPGPNANIPAPWRLIVIVAGILLVLVMGALIRHVLKYSEAESSKSIEQWSIEWSQNQNK